MSFLKKSNQERKHWDFFVCLVVLIVAGGALLVYVRNGFLPVDVPPFVASEYASGTRPAMEFQSPSFDPRHLDGIWKLETIPKPGFPVEDVGQISAQHSYFFFRDDQICTAWVVPKEIGVPDSCDPYARFAISGGEITYAVGEGTIRWTILTVGEDYLKLAVGHPDVSPERQEQWVLHKTEKKSSARKVSGEVLQVPQGITPSHSPSQEMGTSQGGRGVTPSQLTPASGVPSPPTVFPHLTVSPVSQWEKIATEIPKSGLRASFQYPEGQDWFLGGNKVVPELRKWPASVHLSQTGVNLSLSWHVQEFNTYYATWEDQVAGRVSGIPGLPYERKIIGGREVLYYYEQNPGSTEYISSQSFTIGFLAPDRKSIIIQNLYTSPAGNQAELFALFETFLRNLTIETFPPFEPSKVDTITIKNCRASPARVEGTLWGNLTFKNEDNAPHILTLSTNYGLWPEFNAHVREIRLPAQGSATYIGDFDPVSLEYFYSCDQPYDYWTVPYAIMIGEIDVPRPVPTPGDTITIRNCLADPFILQVVEGDRITFVNTDNVPHVLKNSDAEVYGDRSEADVGRPLHQRTVTVPAGSSANVVADFPSWYASWQESFTERYKCDDGFTNAYGINLDVRRKQ